MRLPPDLLELYLADPVGTDMQVRNRMGIPADRYYAVSTWPPERAGFVELTKDRVVRNPKVSKSNQVPA